MEEVTVEAVEDAVRYLVSKVTYNRGYDGLDGLDPLRRLLWKDADGTVAACLEQEMANAQEKVRSGIAFLLGARYLETGSLGAIRAIYASGDAEIAAGVLGSLTGEPTASPSLGAGVVALAVEGLSHPDSPVRASACSVLMNQCAWGVDISSALTPMLELLQDSDAAVRQGAAYATGHFARSRLYDLTRHIALLAGNLDDQNVHVRTAASWALWKLASRRDIACAIGGLVKLLQLPWEYNEPRKYAAGALISFARKSSANRDYVRHAVADSRLDVSKKEVRHFIQLLSTDP